MASTPSLTEINPFDIPWQGELVKKIRKEFDYSKGPHEVLLSGSVGSAKSMIAAHLAVTHCMNYPRARLLLGRRALPDLKDTILQKIIEHMEGTLIKGVHYRHIDNIGYIQFMNRSEIMSRSWADKKYKKIRSLELSAAIIEELTENTSEECEAMHTELIGRVGRLYPEVPETFILYLTNPDDPTHWGYDYFIKGSEKEPNRHVIYSLTKDNIFLPKSYESNLRKKYDPKMCKRLLDGIWLAIETDMIYYQYDSKKHFNKKLKFDPAYPLRITFDFNIGEGKPFSCCVLQYDKRKQKFKFLDEVIVEGARTADALDELAGKGWFDIPGNPKIIIHGDQTGKHRDTRSVSSDYDIIEKFLSNYDRKPHPITRVITALNFDVDVPTKNPPVRTRHNLVNGQLKNDLGHVNIEIDAKCETLDEGFSKTKLKKGGNYVEDDSKRYQHITTAAGYAICSILDETDPEPITRR